MKKSLIFLLFILILPLTTAVNIEMKSDFSKGETILAKFSGSFLDTITKEDVSFYRTHNKIPIEFNIMKAGNYFYIYAINDKAPGNYSLYIEGPRYYNQGEIIDEPFSANFSITDDLADFSINPGFIRTTTGFQVELKNLQETEVVININQQKTQNESETGFFEGLFGNLFLSLTGKTTLNLDEEDSITLYPNEIRKLDFNLGEISEATTKKITFESENSFYEFVAYIPSKIEGSYSVSLNFEPPELMVSLYPNETKEEKVVLENVGNKFLPNITLELSNNLEQYIELSKNTIYNLDINKNAEVLLLFRPENKSQKIEGELTARITNETEDLVIIFEMLGKEVSNETESTSSVSKTCEEIDGELFEEPQICEGEERFAKDGDCCLGKVIEPEKSSTGLIIGWIIILLIIVFLVWFFKFKYKKSKGEVDLFKIARGK